MLMILKIEAKYCRSTQEIDLAVNFQRYRLALIDEPEDSSDEAIVRAVQSSIRHYLVERLGYLDNGKDCDCEIVD